MASSNGVDSLLDELEAMTQSSSLIDELRARTNSNVAVAPSREASSTDGGKKRRRDADNARAMMQEQQTSPPAAAASGRHCTTCTLENELGATSCVACGAQLGPGDAAGWACGTCTFVNTVNTGPRAKCEMCRTRRPKVPPVADAPPQPTVKLEQTARSTGLPMNIKDEEDDELQHYKFLVEQRAKEQAAAGAPEECPAPTNGEVRPEQADEEEEEEEELDELGEGDGGIDDSGDEDDGAREYLRGQRDRTPPFGESRKKSASDKHSRPEKKADASNRESSDSSSDDDGDVKVEPRQVKALLDGLKGVDFEQLRKANVPPTCHGLQLRDFQRQALYWMYMREEKPEPNQCIGGILGDYMGLGKTRTLISLCEATRPRGIPREVVATRVKSFATLVVCPVSLISQWMAEVRDGVTPVPRMLRYYGKARRLSVFQIAQQYDYVFTSFQTLAAEYVESDERSCRINAIHWHRIILDEAHYIRNPRTKMSQACSTYRLVADRRWAVSATPLQNRLDDLLPLLRFLQVPVFSEKGFWRESVAEPIVRGDERAMALLQRLMSNLMLRRMPSSTINGQPIVTLPPKEIVICKVKLSDAEQDFHDAVKQRAQLKLDSLVRRGTRVGTWACAFEMLLRCRQCCLHPYLVVASQQQKIRRGELQVQIETEEGAAQANEAIEAFITELKKKLQTSEEFAQTVLNDVAHQKLTEQDCTICLDVIQQPGILPCAHSYCLPCIKQAIEATKKCPLCKRPTKLKEIHEVPVVEPPPPPPEPATGPQLADVDVRNWQKSSKMCKLLEYIRNVPPGDKVVVFSQFANFLRLIAAMLSSENITSDVFHGGLNHKQRDSLLHHFNNKEHPRVLLATIQTCGVGINLVRANWCFAMDPAWNPGLDEQAMNRVHRIGQTKPVTYVRFLCPNTVEDDVEKLGEKKRNLADLCVDRRISARISTEEILGVLGVRVQRNNNPPPNAGDAADAASVVQEALP